MRVPITRVLEVEPLGENLTLNTIKGDVNAALNPAAVIPYETHEVISNLKEDRSPRWAKGEVVVYVPVNAIIPEDVLKERGYWDTEKNRGLLDGSKKNRVKMRRSAERESRGLLFKVTRLDNGLLRIERGEAYRVVNVGDDVADFFDITEYVPAE